MKLTPEEMRAMQARHISDEDQWRASQRDNPTFVRGGFALSRDPREGRASHIDVGHGTPRCTVCEASIYGDAEWLPDECPLSEDHRHVYPNGEKAPMSPRQRVAAGGPLLPYEDEK